MQPVGLQALGSLGYFLNTKKSHKLCWTFMELYVKERGYKRWVGRRGGVKCRLFSASGAGRVGLEQAQKVFASRANRAGFRVGQHAAPQIWGTPSAEGCLPLLWQLFSHSSIAYLGKSRRRPLLAQYSPLSPCPTGGVAFLGDLVSLKFSFLDQQGLGYSQPWTQISIRCSRGNYHFTPRHSPEGWCIHKNLANWYMPAQWNMVPFLNPHIR